MVLILQLHNHLQQTYTVLQFNVGLKVLEILSNPKYEQTLLIARIRRRLLEYTEQETQEEFTHHETLNLQITVWLIPATRGEVEEMLLVNGSFLLSPPQS